MFRPNVGLSNDPDPALQSVLQSTSTTIHRLNKQLAHDIHAASRFFDIITVVFELFYQSCSRFPETINLSIDPLQLQLSLYDDGATYSREDLLSLCSTSLTDEHISDRKRGRHESTQSSLNKQNRNAVDNRSSLTIPHLFYLLASISAVSISTYNCLTRIVSHAFSYSGAQFKFASHSINDRCNCHVCKPETTREFSSSSWNRIVLRNLFSGYSVRRQLFENQWYDFRKRLIELLSQLLLGFPSLQFQMFQCDACLIHKLPCKTVYRAFSLFYGSDIAQGLLALPTMTGINNRVSDIPIKIRIRGLLSSLADSRPSGKLQFVYFSAFAVAFPALNKYVSQLFDKAAQILSGGIVQEVGSRKDKSKNKISAYPSFVLFIDVDHFSNDIEVIRDKELPYLQMHPSLFNALTELYSQAFLGWIRKNYPVLEQLTHLIIGSKGSTSNAVTSAATSKLPPASAFHLPSKTSSFFRSFLPASSNHAANLSPKLVEGADEYQDIENDEQWSIEEASIGLELVEHKDKLDIPNDPYRPNLEENNIGAIVIEPSISVPIPGRDSPNCSTGSFSIQQSVDQLYSDWIDSSNKQIPTIRRKPPNDSYRLTDSEHLLPTSMLSAPTYRELPIHKEQLASLAVLNQFARQFIILTDGENVFAMDQHAADERIKFEALQKSTCRYLLPAHKRTSIPISLSLAGSHTLHANRELFQKLGWIYSASLNNSDFETKDTMQTSITIEAVPKFFDVEFSKEEFHQILEELVILPKHITRSEHYLPAPFRHILAMKACRSAIMFNDELSVDEQQNVLLSLAQCDQPFICAHGRPAIVPLVSILSPPNSSDLASVSGSQAVDVVWRQDVASYFYDLFHSSSTH